MEDAQAEKWFQEGINTRDTWMSGTDRLIQLFENAARLGHKGAQASLAFIKCENIDAQLEFWIIRQAENGLPYAQFLYSQMLTRYYSGWGFPKYCEIVKTEEQFTLSDELILKAAKQNFAPAQCFLGLNSTFSENNIGTAIYWLGEAFKQGDATAGDILSGQYSNLGNILMQNYVDLRVKLQINKNESTNNTLLFEQVNSIPDDKVMILTVQQWESGPWLARTFKMRDAVIAFINSKPHWSQYTTVEQIIGAIETDAELVSGALYDAGVDPIDSEPTDGASPATRNLRLRLNQ
jgi:hypothetical protein